MTSACAGVLFSIAVRTAWAEVQNLELRHVKPLASVPRGFLADVMEDSNCWGGDIAEVVIHANHPCNEPRRDTVVATCRAACLANIGCQAWSLNIGSHGARGSGRCWLKHRYNSKYCDADPYSVSGFVDHGNQVQRVQAPETVDPADLVGFLKDTNCWGRDLAEVAINSTGSTTRDELIVACKNACVSDRACAAWTLNHGRTGIEGQGHCWLKSSCDGRKHDTRAEAGIVIHNPNNMVSHQPNANGSTPTGGRTKSTGAGGLTPNCVAESTASVADRSSHEGGSTTKSSTRSSADGIAQGGAGSNTQNGSGSTGGGTASVGDRSSRQGGSTATGTGSDAGSNVGETTKRPSEMRFLEHGDLAASRPQRVAHLSEKDRGIIGGVLGSSSGALAVGLLAGLLHPTSPQPSRGLVQPSPTLAAVGVGDAGAKSPALAGSNFKTDIVSGTDVVFDDTDHEEEEEEELVKHWWGWIILIPLFLMAALCFFAIFMFKGNIAGAWSKRKGSRAYSKVGSATSIDTSEDMLGSDPLSPRSSVPLVPLPTTQLRGQQQMSFFTPQQQSQVQGLQGPPSQQAGDNNSLFDALDHNKDGVITRSDFNRAFGVSPVSVGPASTLMVSTLMASDPRVLVGSPPMMLVTPGAPSTTPQVATPVRHPRGLSQSISSVQAAARGNDTFARSNFDAKGGHPPMRFR